MKTTPRTLARPRVEIIPLIDVIFFLMATFVLVVLTMNPLRAIPMTFPRVTGATDTASAPAILRVAAGGELFWNETPIALAGIAPQIALLREATAPAEPCVMITGEAGATYATAITAMDAVRAAGVTRVSIQTYVAPSSSRASPAHE